MVRALDVLVIWKELLGVSVLSLRHAHQRADTAGTASPKV